MAARDKGAKVLTRTKFTGGRRENGVWKAELQDMRTGARSTVTATAIANVAGPWVSSVLEGVPHAATGAKVRLVKGSHIVVPKVHSLGHACILQNTDKRVIFVIPFEGRWSLIGTTDVPVDTPEEAVDITDKETDYLIEAANRFLSKPISRADVVWTFAGVRPLYDDGKSDPSSITRDYTFELDEEGGKAPVLSVYGGKLTTYRCLAESALDKLAPFLPPLGPKWTKESHLPGGDMSNYNAFRDEMFDRYKGFPRDLLDGVVRRHGSRAPLLLGDIQKAEQLGRNFGAGLTEREIESFIADEWAETAEDILWRRTKCGLHMDAAQRQAVEDYLKSPQDGVAARPPSKGEIAAMTTPRAVWRRWIAERSPGARPRKCPGSRAAERRGDRGWMGWVFFSLLGRVNLLSASTPGAPRHRRGHRCRMRLESAQKRKKRPSPSSPCYLGVIHAPYAACDTGSCRP